VASAVSAAERTRTAAPAALARTRLTRPTWLPEQIPAFDGLRGIAILAVLLYHCHARLAGTVVEPFIVWGWCGVSLFFVLSGFLITGLILDAGSSPRFYKNFFARRALRIWPAYWLLLLLYYVVVPLVSEGPHAMLRECFSAPWPWLLLFLQNLRLLALPGAIGPTWSLALEQQFYLFWAPVARSLRPRWLAFVALAMYASSPLMRLLHPAWLTPTHSLGHLDGLAIGSLIATALRTRPWPLAAWRWIARAGLALGVCGIALALHHGSAFTDSLFALGFGGMLLAALTGTRQTLSAPPQPQALGLYCRALTLRPLLFVGKVSYGLYVMHIFVFTMIAGYVDGPLDHFGMAGNIAIVIIRIAAAIGVAALSWHWFERPILGMKRYFR
jgi:peptidoglycan/LPS O-acetylase OafA/YrhL